jgi:hypothetical protein
LEPLLDFAVRSGTDARIPQGQISFDVYKGGQFEPSDKRPIATSIMTGNIVLLPEGAYHI